MAEDPAEPPSPDYFVVPGAINEQEDLLDKHKQTPTNSREHAAHIEKLQAENFGYEMQSTDGDTETFDPEEEQIDIE